MKTPRRYRVEIIGSRDENLIAVFVYALNAFEAADMAMSYGGRPVHARLDY